MELVEDEHLPAPLDRGQRGNPDDLLDLLLGDGGADPVDLPDVGVLAGRGQPGAAARRVARRVQEQSGEGPRGLELVLPAGPTKR